MEFEYETPLRLGLDSTVSASSEQQHRSDVARVTMDVAIYGPELWVERDGHAWSYWDRWFAVVCVIDHDADWRALEQHLAIARRWAAVRTRSAFRICGTSRSVSRQQA